MDTLLEPDPVAPAPQPRAIRRSASGLPHLNVHSVLSFTRLEIPELEVFETAVTFEHETDPLLAHDALTDVFGNKAGFGQYLFRADSAVPARYWVRSLEPWTRWPAGALSALEPKREVIQLAEGLMTDSRCRYAPAVNTWRAAKSAWRPSVRSVRWMTGSGRTPPPSGCAC